jgi:hypothetical protein
VNEGVGVELLTCLSPTDFCHPKQTFSNHLQKALQAQINACWVQHTVDNHGG